MSNNGPQLLHLMLCARKTDRCARRKTGKIEGREIETRHRDTAPHSGAQLYIVLFALLKIKRAFKATNKHWGILKIQKYFQLFFFNLIDAIIISAEQI